MSVRTTEELSDYLAQDMAWRKKELTSLLSVLDSPGIPVSKQNVLIRCGIAMLYAHWEGFIKSSASAYLEFVLTRRHPYKELTNNFISLAIKDNLENIWKTKKLSHINEITEFFLEHLSERCKITYKDVVDTQSNLSSDVLKEIICILNLDYKLFETKEKIINEKLLRTRNNIAHGGYFKIDIINIDEYRNLHEEVITLLNIFNNQIDNAAFTKAYLRPSKS